MKWMKHTALALATGAALSFAAVAPSTAAPVGQSTAIATGDAAALSDNIIDVRRRGHWGGRRHGHRHHRGRGFRGWWIPFAAAPLLYGGYAYGRGYGGNSCYAECREFYGPGYCRYNWRRFC
jgi:hypothetical protein